MSREMSRQRGGTGPAPASHSPSHHARPIASVGRALALAGAFVFLTGCIGVAEKAASLVAKPVLGLAVKDAKTTLAWVDREVEAERILPVQAEAAKRCPEAVIALDALRTRMGEGAAGVEGFRGLIYYGTLNRYGQGVQAEAGRHLERLARSCLPLIPAEKLIKIF